MSLEATILLSLFIKHFICDFPLQANPWMYKNKGTYGHLGGLFHAAVHGYGTCLALIATFIIFPPAAAELYIFLILCCAVLDMFVHYHIDWAKMNIGSHYNLKPDNSEMFWILLGIDQLLHALTYFFINHIIGVWT